MLQMGKGQFKAEGLKLMDQAQQTREEFVITKHDRPVAKLVQVELENPGSILGYLQGSVEINRDIVAPVNEVWGCDRH